MYNSDIIREIDGKELYTKLTGQFSSFFSRMFSGDYKNVIAGLQLYLKSEGKLKYQQAVELADQLG